MKRILQLMDMKGHCALITGATGGLGTIMAETLAELGADLILVDRPESDFEQLETGLSKNFDVNVRSMHCDLESEEDRSLLIDQVKSEKPGLNCLVNNAAFVGTSGLTGWVEPFEKQTVDTWRRAVEVNLTAVFDLSKAFYPVIKQSGHGSIINIASIYGVNGPDYSLYEGTEMGNPAAYAASKGGLLQLTRWLATTLAPDVRVNAISPGGVFRNQPEAFVERYTRRTPLQRMALEDDFKGATAFLASDLSAYVTGQNVVIDGGWGVW